MRTSNTRVRKFSATIGKVVMALVFVSMIGGVSIAPAFGRDSGRGGHSQQGRGGHGGARGGYYRGGHYYPYGYYYDGYYPPPVYAPPPVVYAPAPYQSPGITLAFPIRIR
jgi:hypothetical protein